jgi:hypothetical protein
MRISANAEVEATISASRAIIELREIFFITQVLTDYLDRETVKR